MKVKEIREEIKKLQSLGYTPRVKLNAPEYKLLWEMHRLKGFEVRDRLLAEGYKKLILKGEEKTREIDLAPEKRIHFLECSHDIFTPEFIDSSDRWVVVPGFRGYVEFSYE